MEKDLFGYTKRPRKRKLESALQKMDSQSFSSRLERLQYLNKIIPKNLGFVFSVEMHYLLSEAINCLINGQCVATILLSQSFIEHWLEDKIEQEKVKKQGKKNLATIVKAMKENNTIQIGLLDKIDRLRKIRNPFVHFKPNEKEFNIVNMSYFNNQTPEDFLYKEAKNAISLLYQVSITNFN
ncbi:MAG TPA: hypothetical protein VJ954_03845 [Ignavibacteriaceae bacterium]|nr:hypothetical protein [Ignavibacteriaceae bacterium]